MSVISILEYSRNKRQSGVPLKDKAALEYAIEWRDYCLNNRYQYEDMWLEGYELYNQKSRAKSLPGRANLFVPVIYQTVESMIPDVMLSLFTAENIIKILPAEPEYTENARKMQKMFEHNMKISKLFIQLEMAVRDALLYGDSVCKIPLRFVFDSFGRLKKIPSLIPQDPWDVTLDPGHWEIQNMHGISLRVEATAKHLKQMQQLGIYKNVNAALGTPPLGAGETRTGVRERLASRGLSVDTYGSPQYKWEIWEHWVDDRVIVTCGDSVILRNDKNPFEHGMKPFVKFSATPLSRETYNKGIPELLKGLQKEMNLYRNARLDNILIGMNKVFAIERTARINPADLIMRPGGIIHTDDIDGIKSLQVGDVPHTAFLETDAFDRDIQKTTGVWDYMQGATPTHEETATGIIRLQQAAGQRLALLIRRMQEGPLPEYAEMVTRLIQQFSDEEVNIPYVSTKDQNISWETITQDQLIGDFVFEFTSRPEDLDPNKKQNDSIALYNLTNNNPLANQAKLLEDLYRFVVKEDLEQYLNPQALQALKVQTQMLSSPDSQNAQSLAMMLGPGGAAPGMGMGMGMGMGINPQTQPGFIPQEGAPIGNENLPPEIVAAITDMLGGMGGF